ncbi:hypothetical protein ABZ614_11160 [Streptomyces sp. NPDC013178]|uniref:hypothetical protein n=1 Tax=Streptomyces sp. NPDC013178 TaxID=3155118 RepID=UPI0033CE3897
MRTALAAAVHCLLGDARLSQAPVVARLASVVLLAKAPASSSRVRILYRDLAGWLGCSVSHVGHTVLPTLRRAGVVTSTPDRDASGTKAVVLDLLPLREARAAHEAHPLALLTKDDLATLLRMSEAVTCPGWAPADKPETPAGFMAARKGHNAAVDRLAMVLLVLEARRDGRVRMAPGRVAAGYGRADATLARVLGCSAAAAVPVVDRLVRLGVVELEGPDRNRLRVPPVAEAFTRTRLTQTGVGRDEATPAPGKPAPCPRCSACADGDAREELVLAGKGWRQESFDDVPTDRTQSAFRDHNASPTSSSQVITGTEGRADSAGSAGLHTDHTSVVDLSGLGSGDRNCFSGSAGSHHGDRRGRAHTRDDHPARETAADGHQATGRPLRRDKPDICSPRSGMSFGSATSWAGGASIPADLALVLAPVRELWGRVTRETTRRWLAREVRLELTRIGGVVGAEYSQRALAARLLRRLEQQTAPVHDVAGWLLRRGLPQRAECWSVLCDDGVRMDTGGACESCQCRLADRQAVRKMVVMDIAARWPPVPIDARRHLVDQELRARFADRVAHDLTRRGQAAQEREQREGVIDQQRAQLARREAERVAAACQGCGLPEAGGMCMQCALAERTADLVDQAIDVVVALRADFDDAPEVTRLVRQVERDTWSVVRQVNAGIEDPSVRAYAEYDRARRLLKERRRSALARLEVSAPAEAEAVHVQRTVLRRHGQVTADVREKARMEAAAARTRAAHGLLAEYLGDVYRFRAAFPTSTALPRNPAKSDVEQWKAEKTLRTSPRTTAD